MTDENKVGWSLGDWSLAEPHEYIAKPPPSREGSPWILCPRGSARYALTNDTGYPFEVVEDPDQYDLLAVSVGLERFIVRK